jgi:hypothetical protein
MCSRTGGTGVTPPNQGTSPIILLITVSAADISNLMIYEEIPSPLQASPRRTARWGLDGSLRSQAPFGIVSNATHYNILSSTIVSDMISGFLA